MLEEKLKRLSRSWKDRQAANDPQSLGIEASEDLVINGKVDLDDLVMVIAGGP
jgi:hypothetical protein